MLKFIPLILIITLFSSCSKECPCESHISLPQAEISEDYSFKFEGSFADQPGTITDVDTDYSTKGLLISYSSSNADGSNIQSGGNAPILNFNSSNLSYSQPKIRIIGPFKKSVLDGSAYNQNLNKRFKDWQSQKRWNIGSEKNGERDMSSIYISWNCEEKFSNHTEQQPDGSFVTHAYDSYSMESKDINVDSKDFLEFIRFDIEEDHDSVYYDIALEFSAHVTETNCLKCNVEVLEGNVEAKFAVPIK